MPTEVSTHHQPVMFSTEDEWQNAIEEAKDALSHAYMKGEIDVPQPVDKNLQKLATTIATRVIRSAN
jgi:hypothetical protein